MAELFHYFVEGECEKKLISAFSHTENNEIKTGKVEVFNVLIRKFTTIRMKGIKKGTHVVFIYDSDTTDISTLKYNIEMLKKYAQIDEDHIIHVISVKNFEDEIIRSTDIKNINELLNTKGTAEFKKKFIDHNNIVSVLMKHGFDINKIWVTKPSEPFDKYSNDNTDKIKNNKNKKK